MNIGALRHRIVLDEPVDTQDDTGSVVTTFAPWGRVWASVEPIRGREALIANQTLVEANTLIRIRWSPGVANVINAKWRARHGTTVYNFKSVTHVEEGRREIHITVQSGLNDG